MSSSHKTTVKWMKWTVVLCMIFTACTLQNVQDTTVNSVSNYTTETNFIKDFSTPTPAIVYEDLTPLPTTNLLISPNCKLGLGLRAETLDLLLEHKNQIDFIMSASSILAEQYFSEFEGATRIIAAPSLKLLMVKGERALANKVPFEAIGYGLETSKSTPDEEWQDLVESTKKARDLSKKYEKLLVLGPGFKLLSTNEDKYGPMGAFTDIWMLQTQQLQKGPPSIEYRQEIERIVKLIRSENPEVEVWAQITLPPDRVPDANEWLAYHRFIFDLVDGVFIGVYTWDHVDQDHLIETIKTIIETACEEK